MSEYRIMPYGDGFEPQLKSTAGMVDGEFWYPLNSEGYWLEPDAFSYGKITQHISMPEEAAKRAILRARAINAEHISISSAKAETP